jgi:hypothetical protein
MGSLGPERKKRSPKTTKARMILFWFDKRFDIEIYFFKPFLNATPNPGPLIGSILPSASSKMGSMISS